MYYSEDFVEEVRSKNDIVDVISERFRVQKKGSTYFGLCPFHNEKSPSFSVSREKQMYYCFGCGAGGNVFTFLMEYENFTCVEALTYLAERAGMKMPEGGSSEIDKRERSKRARILDMNKEAAKYFYVQLKSKQGEMAHQYLIKRGLSEEIIKQFGLGYSCKYKDDLYQYLKKKGYSAGEMQEAGLVTIREKEGVYDKFWNRVMFPIMDVNNRVIGFGGRVMGDGKPKYLNSPETPVFDKSRNLYGLNMARKSRKNFFLVCEGYMDVIALHQAGFTNAVASLGTALTTGHASLIHRYAKEVYLTYDSDAAGTGAALRAIPLMKEAGIHAKVIRMAPYKDPDELIKNQGAEGFEACMEKAKNGFLFEIQMLENEFDMKSPEGKTDFYHEIAKKLCKFEEELERSNYIDAVAREYGLPVKDLRALVAKMAVTKEVIKITERPKDPMRKKRETGKDKLLAAQRRLLTWMAEKEYLIDQVKGILKEEDFTTPIYRQVAKMLWEQHEKGGVDPAKILDSFELEEEHREIASLFHARVEGIQSSKDEEKAFKENLLRVKKAGIEERMKRLSPTDMKGLQELVDEQKMMQNMEQIQIHFSERE